MDPYKVLGLKRNASKEEAKKAYRKIARESHPDKNPDDKAAEEKFKAANAAYEEISNPKPKSNPGHRSGSVHDIMNQWKNWGWNGGKKHHATARVTISFTESCFGVSKSIEYEIVNDCAPCMGVGATTENYTSCTTCGGSGQMMRRHGGQVVIGQCPSCSGKGIKIITPCSVCKGEGSKKNKEFKDVDIPPGTSNGTTYNLITGSGNTVYLQVIVLPGENLTREQGSLDVHSRQKMSLKDALLGCKITVQTVHGDKMVTMEECAQPGTKVRLKGCGAKNQNTGAFGNHIAHIDIEFPTKLSRKQRKIIKEAFSDREKGKKGRQGEK